MKYLFLFFIISLSSFAQNLSNGITYKLLRDNTDTRFIYGNLALVNLTLSGSRMSLAGGPGIKFYNKGLYVTADYEFHYLDGLADALNETSQTSYSVYKRQNSRNAQASVGYFFRTPKEKKVSLYVKSSGGMSKTTHYYVNVDAHVTKIFGFELGYKSGFSNISISDNVTVNNDSRDIPGPSSMSTVMMYNCLSFGPSFGKSEDVIADISGYGIKKAQFFSKFFVNLLYAPKIVLEDVYVEVENQTGTGSNGSLMYRYKLDGNIAVSRLGFNFGYESIKFNRFGLSARYELGILPGIKRDLANNIYFSFKTGLSLGKIF